MFGKNGDLVTRIRMTRVSLSILCEARLSLTFTAPDLLRPVRTQVRQASDDPDNNPRFTPDFRAEIALVDDVEALVEHLNVKLTAGQLSDVEKADITDVVSTITIDGDDADFESRKRVQTAILMIMASGAYAVQN